MFDELNESIYLDHAKLTMMATAAQAGNRDMETRLFDWADIRLTSEDGGIYLNYAVQKTRCEQGDWRSHEHSIWCELRGCNGGVSRPGKGRGCEHCVACLWYTFSMREENKVNIIIMVETELTEN